MYPTAHVRLCCRPHRNRLPRWPLARSDVTQHISLNKGLPSDKSEILKATIRHRSGSNKHKHTSLKWGGCIFQMTLISSLQLCCSCAHASDLTSDSRKLRLVSGCCWMKSATARASCRLSLLAIPVQDSTALASQQKLKLSLSTDCREQRRCFLSLASTSETEWQAFKIHSACQQARQRR